MIAFTLLPPLIHPDLFFNLGGIVLRFSSQSDQCPLASDEILSNWRRACHVITEDKYTTRFKDLEYLLKEVKLVFGVVKGHRASDSVESLRGKVLSPDCGEVDDVKVKIVVPVWQFVL